MIHVILDNINTPVTFSYFGYYITYQHPTDSYGLFDILAQIRKPFSDMLNMMISPFIFPPKSYRANFNNTYNEAYLLSISRYCRYYPHANL